ncbi:MAG: ATP-binding protein [Bacteroidales bacterium]|nr:ATP-binding protein [Bacteroidales bacterium]
MSLIRKPSQIEATQALATLIYGVPGIGKTTLACSAPDAVLFDFDNGVARINGAHRVDTVQISKWEDAIEAFEEVKSLPYKTIVVDTVGRMLNTIEAYIKRAHAGSALVQRDGNLSLKGFGKRKEIFAQFTLAVKSSGRNVIYVAHEIERKDTIGAKEVTKKRPEVGGSSTNDLMKDLDLVGYMEAYDRKRTITFDPTEQIYAKNCCGMYGVIDIPLVVDNKGNAIGENNFFAKVVESYHERLRRNNEIAQQFEELCDLIRANADGITNAEDANAYAAWVKGVQHIYNSKAVAGQALKTKVAELGLVFDKASKTYRDPEPTNTSENDAA